MEENINFAFEKDYFMKKFKYYKSNKPNPSLDQVLRVVNNEDNLVRKFVPKEIQEDLRTLLIGLRSPKEWQSYMFQRHPGLIFIKNPFTNAGQRYWIRKCLEEYPQKPNKLNIDIKSNYQNWWAECFRNSVCDKQLLKKLRWATLGYHHNWDTKVYSEANKTPFPEDLAELSDVFAKYLGYENFRAEAAIVNYYHMNSTLSAHTDHSEVNLDAPLFSFSFGQSAIFLIGSNKKSIEPSALLINSGDVIIMSKEARLCYHAVPKILPSQDTPWEGTDYLISTLDIPNLKYKVQPEEIRSTMKKNTDDKEWQPFKDYIQESRINMNVRQVLNEKQTSL